MSARLPPAIFLMGPTASGKTDLAVELVSRLPVDIVSVDSAMVYRHMDIGTAKPGADILASAPHRLIDILDPDRAYSAARFREDALRHMAEITAAGRVPLLVGGTMLYFKALLEGLSELPPADPHLRREIEERARAHGWPALHAELGRVDPILAARLKPTDAQRIQRALEVYRLTGHPLSALQGRKRALPYRVLAVGLVPESRAVLHARIAQRFQAMLGRGLVDEVRWLRAHFALHPGLPSMRCVGYRQVWAHLEGRLSEDALASQGIAATRQLAKRQLTWLRAWPQLTCVEPFSPTASARVRAAIEAHLG